MKKSLYTHRLSSLVDMFKGSPILDIRSTGFTSPLHPLKNRQPSFSGYRVDGRQVRFFLPGYAPEKPREKFVVQTRVGEGAVREIQMIWDAEKAQWRSVGSAALPPEQKLAYRFMKKASGEDVLHFLDHGPTSEEQPSAQDVKTLSSKEVKERYGRFNVLEAHARDPQSNGANLLIFPDSFVDSASLAKKLKSPDAKRNHYNVFGGGFNASTFPILEGLIQKFGFQVTEARPIVGGNPMPSWDRTGAHGYWTSNLFQRTPKLRTEEDFKQLALDHLRSGTKLCFDAAFVSGGLNSIYYMSNLLHRSDSPFVKRFIYDGIPAFPDERLKLGVLPTKWDEKAGEAVVNNEAWDLRFISPSHHADQDESIWYVELYDPRVQDASGKRLENAPLLTSYRDSVQNYRFPVRGGDIQAMKKALEKAKDDPSEQKLLKRYWPSFQFEPAAVDNSGEKWDGQRDQVKLKPDHKVNQYDISQSLAYWTDKVNRIYIYNVARSLESIRRQNPTWDWEQVVAGLYDKNVNKEFLLPKPDKPLGSELSGEALRRVLSEDRSHLLENTQQPPRHVVNFIHKQFRMESLPGSPTMQIIFATPLLKKIMIEGDRPASVRAFNRLFRASASQMIWDGDYKGGGIYADSLFTSLVKKLHLDPLMGFVVTAEPFLSRLEKKLQVAMADLPLSLRDTLCDPNISRIFHENIAKSVFISLLTGKAIHPHDVQKLPYEKIVAAMEAKVPAYIQHAPPKQAARLLASWMSSELDKMDIKKLNLAGYLSKRTRKISTESVSIAEHVLNVQGLGLHWRIDALKDFADLGTVLSLPDNLKSKAMDKQTAFLEHVYDNFTDAVRGVFKKSIIRPEVTDLPLFLNPSKVYPNPEVDALRKRLIGEKRFDGITNFDYFNHHYSLIKACGKPDEGLTPTQLTPSEYIEKALKPMMASLPLHNVFQYQNLLTNQDYSTSLYWLSLHPVMARADHMPWLGLLGKDGFVWEGLNELHHKKQLGLDPGLNFEQVQLLKRALEAVSNDPKGYSDLVQAFIQHTDTRPRPAHYQRPVPANLKSQFIDEFFEKHEASDFKLSETQYETLQANFKKILLEPSETKALRGRLSNAFQELLLEPKALVQHGFASEADAIEVLDKLKPVLDKAAWDTVQSFPETQRRWLGYQQFDFFIDHLLKNLPAEALPRDAAVQSALKQALYTQMVKPALDQYLRLAALVTAIPGDPTYYMPDLFGQAGGEDTKNRYLGNRELLRLDWVEKNPVLKQYHDQLAQIIRLRKQFPVLNTGHVTFPLDPATGDHARQALDNTGILPILRDDGDGRQMLCLINTGKADSAWGSWQAAHETSRYAEIQHKTPFVKDFKLDLSHLRLPVGTMYRNIVPQTPNGQSIGQQAELYVINAQHQLVRKDDPEKGIDVDQAAFLERV